MGPEKCNDWLAQAFSQHGVPVERRGEQVFLGPHGLRADTRVQERGRAVQLDVAVQWRDGRWIVESFGGLGASVRAAQGEAFAAFLQGSFHVLFEAVCEGRCEHPVETETWTVGERPYTAYLGPMATRSSSQQALPPPPAGELVKRLRGALRPERVHPELSWLRVYFARLTGQEDMLEVLLDNSPWEEGRAALQGLPWPEVDGYFSARVFLMLRAQDSARAPR